MDEARQIATNVILDVLDDWDNTDRMYMKKRVRDELARFVYAKTKRKPMILPVIMNM
jgi:ribonuclease J